MKHNKKRVSWIFVSIGVGLLTGILSYLIFFNYKISILILILVTSITFIYNPVRRYIKIFWAAFSSFIFLNKFSIDFVVDLANLKINISNNTSIILSTFLFVLCIIALILDFFERNKSNFKKTTKRKNIFKKNRDIYYSKRDITINKKTDENI